MLLLNQMKDTTVTIKGTAYSSKTVIKIEPIRSVHDLLRAHLLLVFGISLVSLRYRHIIYIRLPGGILAELRQCFFAKHNVQDLHFTTREIQ